MSQIAQQIITPTLVVNGPINFSVLGPCATLTFTVMRGDLDQMMKGQPQTKMTAAVATRLVMPLDVAAQLKVLLNQIIQDQPIGTIAPGTTRTQ